MLILSGQLVWRNASPHFQTQRQRQHSHKNRVWFQAGTKFIRKPRPLSRKEQANLMRLEKMVQQKQQTSTKQLNVETETTSAPASSNDNNEWTISVMTDLKSLKSKLRKSVRKNKKSTKNSKKDAKDEVHAKLVDIFGSKKKKEAAAAAASTAPQQDAARQEEQESRDDNDQVPAEPNTTFSNVNDSIDMSIFDETTDETTGEGILLDYDDDEEEQVSTNNDQWSSKTRSGRLSILPPPSAGTLLETIIDECDEQDDDGDLMIWQDDDDNDAIDASLFDEQQEEGKKAQQEQQERFPLQDIQKNQQPQHQHYYSRDQLTSPTATLNSCSDSNINSSPLTPDLSNDALLKDVDMSKLWQQSMLDATATRTSTPAAAP